MNVIHLTQYQSETRVDSRVIAEQLTAASEGEGGDTKKGYSLEQFKDALPSLARRARRKKGRMPPSEPMRAVSDFGLGSRRR